MPWYISLTLSIIGALVLYRIACNTGNEPDTPAEAAESRYHTQAQAEVELRVADIRAEMARQKAIPVQLPKRERVSK